MGADQVFTYSIKTESDLKALTDARKALEEQKKVYQELGQSTATLEKSLKQIDAALESQAAKSLKVAKGWNEAIEKVRSAGGNVDAMVAERNAVLKQGGLSAPGRLSEAFSAYKGAGGGLEGLKEAAGVIGKGPLIAATVGVAAIEKGAEALREYAKAEETVAKLDAALAQRGQLLDGYRESLNGLAEEQQKLTGISKGEWVDTIKRLVQFGTEPDEMPKAVEAVKNLAGILDGDLSTAALHVGKALNGNFESLSRLGIQFDDHMTQAQKLDRLWSELSQRGGGQLEAQADTLSGSWRRLKNGTGDLAESFGHIITSILPVKATLYGLGTSAQWVAEQLGAPIEKSKQLKNAVKETGDAMIDSKASEAYITQIDKTKEAIAGASKELADYLSKLNEQAGNTKAELEAKFNRDNALIDKQVKEGKLTPQQAAIAKAKLENDKANTVGLIDEDTAEKSRKKISETIASENKRVEDKRREMDAAEAESQAVQRVAKDRLAMRTRLERDAANAQYERDKLGSVGLAVPMEEADKKVAETKEALEQGLKNFDAYYGPSGPRERQRAAEAAKRAKDAFEEVSKEVGDANQDRLGQVQSIDEAQRSSKRVREYESETRRAKAGVSITDAAGQNATAPNIATVPDQVFKAHLPQSQTALQAIEANLKAADQYWGGIASGMSRIANLTSGQADALRMVLERQKDLERKMEITQSQIRNAPSR